MNSNACRCLSLLYWTLQKQIKILQLFYPFLPFIGGQLMNMKISQKYALPIYDIVQKGITLLSLLHKLMQKTRLPIHTLAGFSLNTNYRKNCISVKTPLN